jgi:hypothetical protein
MGALTTGDWEVIARTHREVTGFSQTDSDRITVVGCPVYEPPILSNPAGFVRSVENDEPDGG